MIVSVWLNLTEVLFCWGHTWKSRYFRRDQVMWVTDYFVIAGRYTSFKPEDIYAILEGNYVCKTDFKDAKKMRKKSSLYLSAQGCKNKK